MPLSHVLWAWVGCFVTISLFGLMDAHLASLGVPYMLGSYGTISVLAFGVGLRAPVLRPWNVIAGHLIAASCAVLCLGLPVPVWLARALALASAVAAMLWTGSVHPPGGALVMVLMESAKFQALGWTYVLYPGLAGAMLLMCASAATDELKRRFIFTSDDIAQALGAGRHAAKTA